MKDMPLHVKKYASSVAPVSHNKYILHYTAVYLIYNRLQGVQETLG